MNSGIYKIENKINKDCYIGSSKNLIRREKDHFYLLRRNRNHCKLLQRAVNKYGIDNFKFEILLFCEIYNLFDTEQEIVDAIDPKYNICKIDVSVPIGIPKTIDGKRRIGEANKLKTNPKFGWPSRIILQLDNEYNIIKEYKSLTEYSKENKCSIGTVGIALKKGHKCKGFYLKYKY